MINNIRLHLFIGTTVILFGWYYAVDTLPRAKLIPEYLASVVAAANEAAARGDVGDAAFQQPRFFMDNPVVSVEAADDGRYAIRLAKLSKRRCDQITTSRFVKENAEQVVVTGSTCGEGGEIRLLMQPK